MFEEIGVAAGKIWQALDANGEMTLAKLKKEVDSEGALFDWAIGWLAREDKIELVRDKRSYRISLKGREVRRATAA